MKYHETNKIYKAFGLIISSPINMPELIEVKEEVTYIDLEIRQNELANEASNRKPTYKATEIYFEVPKIVSFSVQNGKRIVFTPLENYDEDMARLYLLGSCMAIVLFQKRIFPLHGSVIAIENKAYAIIGESGAGKSTLAAQFIKEGYKLLSDDIIALTISNGVVCVLPAYPQQKLWKDSLSKFNKKSENYRSIFGRENKYCVPIYPNFCDNILPLEGIIELVAARQNDIELIAMENLQQITTLRQHTFRNFLINEMALNEWHFHTSLKILEQSAMYKLLRPLHKETGQNLMKEILKAVKKEAVL